MLKPIRNLYGYRNQKAQAIRIGFLAWTRREKIQKGQTLKSEFSRSDLGNTEKLYHKNEERPMIYGSSFCHSDKPAVKCRLPSFNLLYQT